MHHLSPAHVFQCVPCSPLTAYCLLLMHGPFPCIAGSVVNVPTDLSRVQSMLPRTFDQSETLMVGLKRKLGHKTAYLQQNIRPTAVWEALRDLMPTPLYKDKVTLLDEQDWARANADVFEGETAAGIIHASLLCTQGAGMLFGVLIGCAIRDRQ